ncbi:MAG: Para-aminobenzoate synthase, aminase component (EC [uncultured Campylobacterales bacterium]|uniref:Para-aminobenzoate synthase, aminase component (EC) n=1 Tax=uncultured Campylobacterales bacterium TaxID=352960 RepID=A0A6S6TFK6_9BACT|nr:MAG: Para-aminobenzoate synthase, aminase component (EC [uncultured Campylobacterales bacterium]
MDNFLNKKEFTLKLNKLGSSKTPCLFFSNFEASKFFITTNLNHPDILYKFNSNKNYNNTKQTTLSIKQKDFIEYKTYLEQFSEVQNKIKEGNTYLLNLTSKTKINTPNSLQEIFYNTDAKFTFLYKDKFTFFSPERFIKIQNNKISTYPMKGTIDASTPNAKELLLSSPKELAEHTMIVDLLRNDLSKISNNVQVERFRYTEQIKTNNKNLITTSSKISSKLEQNWQKDLGSIISELLPAGSISGTPKRSTCNIIKNIEDYERDFFTGICAIFDGQNLDSAIMIRFIERKNNELYYKSGGGITIDSDIDSEYEEMCQKVYFPIG